MYENTWITRDPKPDFREIARQGQADRRADAGRSALSRYGTDPESALSDAYASQDAPTIAAVRGMRSNDAEASQKSSAEAYAGYKTVLEGLRRIPMEKRGQARDALISSPSAQFLPPKAIEAARAARLDDEALDVEIGQVDRKLHFMSFGETGGVAIDERTGKPVEEYRAPVLKRDPKMIYEERVGSVSGAPAQPPAETAGEAGARPQSVGAPPPPEQKTPEFESFRIALRDAESSDRPGVAGPMTQYGQAHGTMQVLDSTGEAMAERIGVPWQPELMRGTSPEATAYQDAIGEAYAQEAWQASNGDPRTAAMYYHGGPDRSKWGPKTRKHGEKVVERMGQGGAAQGAAVDAAATGYSPTPGYRIVQEPQSEREWADMPGGGQRNTRTNETKGVPTPDDGPLDPESIDFLAANYIARGATGLPSFGMGRAGQRNRNAVLNRAAQLAEEQGITGYDAVERLAEVKATTSALGQITKMHASVRQFEQTALKNADLMLELAPKGAGQTNTPVMNRWLQAGRKQVAGDKDVASFDIAIGTFSDEYAKIITGNTGSAGATEGARKEAYDRLSKYATQGQLRSGVATMKREMHNRLQSLEDEEKRLKSTLSRRPGQSQPSRPAVNLDAMSAQQRASVRRFRGSTGKPGTAESPYVPTTEDEYNHVPSGQHYIHPDGKVKVKP